jgi:hypothetical protein
MDPINDPVMMLLETPFMRWNNIHKKDMIRKGKPTPFLSCQSLTKKVAKYYVDCLILRGMIWIHGFVEAITNKRYFVSRVYC